MFESPPHIWLKLRIFFFFFGYFLEQFVMESINSCTIVLQKQGLMCCGTILSRPHLWGVWLKMNRSPSCRSQGQRGPLLHYYQPSVQTCLSKKICKYFTSYIPSSQFNNFYPQLMPFIFMYSMKLIRRKNVPETFQCAQFFKIEIGHFINVYLVQFMSYCSVNSILMIPSYFLVLS